MDRNELLNDPETAQLYALTNLQKRLWTSFPAIVESVDYSKMTCSCQPAIQGVQLNYDGSQNYVNLPLLVDCPITFPSAGGFVFTLPLAQGDEVLVTLAARCIDAWWQQGGVQPPMELRMHDLSDGFAIPGPRSLPKAAAVSGGFSSANAELRNDAGTVKLSITPTGTVNILAPAGMVVTGDLTVIGDTIVAGLKVGGAVTTPSGPLSITGDVDISGDMVADGISYGSHRHTGVVPGGGDSGGPV